LSKERIAELKMYFTRCVQSRSLSTVVHLAECGLELIEMVEALQQENEQLKADCDRYKERLQISPYGDDKIDELDEALENCKFQYEQLKQENEQLQAQVAQYRETLI